MSDTKRCVGCTDDYYNGKNSQGIQRCWLLENARPVTRYRLGWWTPPTAQGNFTKVEVNHCWHAPGQYLLYEEIPRFAQEKK